MCNSQSTETDNTDLLAWSGTISDKGREHGQTSTQPEAQHNPIRSDSHGSSFDRLELLWDGEDESLLSSNVGRVTALVLGLVGPYQYPQY